MIVSSLLSVLAIAPLSVSSSILPPPQHVFSNPSTSPPTTLRIPSIHESAVQARRIFSLTPLGTLSTVFPPHASADEDAGLSHTPSSLGGAPIGLMDYTADCSSASKAPSSDAGEQSTQDGDPVILAISIATSFKNVEAGSNISLSLRWHPPSNYKYAYSAASLPRFSLMGYLAKIPDEEVLRENIAQCFVGYHADAAAWLPGNPIHRSEWVRLVVQEVYWIGGFGDRAYIGWIPAEEWRSVTKAEMDSIRLPGEIRAGAGAGAEMFDDNLVRGRISVEGSLMDVMRGWMPDWA